MREIVVTEFISLDGASIRASRGPRHGAGRSPYWNDEIAAFKLAETLGADALLLGRVRTRDSPPRGPGRTDEAGLRRQDERDAEVVVSSTLREPEWNNTTVIDVEQIASLEGRILVAGSMTLVRSAAGARARRMSSGCSSTRSSSAAASACSASRRRPTLTLAEVHVIRVRRCQSRLPPMSFVSMRRSQGYDDDREETEMTHLDNRTRWLALYLLCLGDLMIVLDTTIVNVALPSIRNDLGFSQTSLAWVVNAYILTFGGFLLLGGRLADLFGARRLFLGGISLFTVASLACGLSTSQGLLVGARAVQGVGGAVVSAVAFSLIMNLFTEPGERAKAMGVFGFVMSGGGTIGVLLGGVLTDTLSWHWIFLVNLPIGVARLRPLAAAAAGSAAASRRDGSTSRARSP